MANTAAFARSLGNGHAIAPRPQTVDVVFARTAVAIRGAGLHVGGGEGYRGVLGEIERRAAIGFKDSAVDDAEPHHAHLHTRSWRGGDFEGGEVGLGKAEHVFGIRQIGCAKAALGIGLKLGDDGGIVRACDQDLHARYWSAVVVLQHPAVKNRGDSGPHTRENHTEEGFPHANSLSAGIPMVDSEIPFQCTPRRCASIRRAQSLVHHLASTVTHSGTRRQKYVSELPKRRTLVTCPCPEALPSLRSFPRWGMLEPKIRS